VHRSFSQKAGKVNVQASAELEENDSLQINNNCPPNYYPALSKMKRLIFATG